MKSTLKHAVDLMQQLEDTLESYEPRDDVRAWLLRETFRLLSRARGIIEALLNSEGEETK
jgi:hypothetical protein